MFQELFISNLSGNWRHVLETVYLETGDMFQELIISNSSRDLETLLRHCSFLMYLEI